MNIIGSPLHDAVKSALHDLVTSAPIEHKGYKVAFAKAPWHGSRSFSLAGDDQCGGVSAEVAPSTKYLSKTIVLTSSDSSTETVIDRDGNEDTGSRDCTAELNRTVTVDPDTGEITISGPTQELETTDVRTGNTAFGLGTLFSIEQLLDLGNIRMTCGILEFPASLSGRFGSGRTPEEFAAGETFDNPLLPDVTANSMTVTASATRTTLTIRWSYSLVHHRDPDPITHEGGNSGSGNGTTTVTITYTAANTGSAVSGKALSYLDKWSFDNNTSWEWRTDAGCFSGPMVSNNSYPIVGPDQGVPWTEATTGVDRPDLPVGTLLGAPGTPEQSGGGFNRLAFLAYYGDLSGPYGGLTPPGFVLVCKWAECVVNAIPSHNFDRPCLPDDLEALEECPAVVPGSWNDPAPKGKLIVRRWLHDFRDMVITPGIRPTTQSLKEIQSGQHTQKHGYVEVKPPALMLDDVFGTLWEGAVVQYMYDPIHACDGGPCDPPGYGMYLPASAVGAKLEEALVDVPVGETLPAGSRPLDCGGFVAALNSGIGRINPECYQPIRAGSCAGVLAYDDVPAPWDYVPEVLP